MKNNLAISALLLFSLLTSSVAQSPSAQVPKQDAGQEDVVSITTNLVQIDVVVTDKEGKPVSGLGPEDFEISESGKRQQITHFSYVEAEASPPSENGSLPASKASGAVAPARLRREHVRRTVAVVIDDLGISFESIESVRKALRQFVDEQMQASDLVAILRTSSGMGAAQQFTSDKRLLHAAIEGIRWYPAGRVGASTFARANEMYSEEIKGDAKAIDELEEARQGIYSAGTLSTVKSIVRGFGKMPGRKSVVLFSEMFRLFSARGRNERLVNEMRQLTEEANASSTTIYTIDTSGLQTFGLNAEDRASGIGYLFDPRAMEGGGGPLPAPTPTPDSTQSSLSAQAERDSQDAFRKLRGLSEQRENQRGESQSVLSYLATRTGGLFVRNRNDLGAGMRDVMNDQKGFYLIGFRPGDAPLDARTGRRRLRSLEVKVKGSGLKVRARSGYSGITDGESRPARRTRDEQISEALLSPFASDDVRVRLTSLFGVEPGGGGAYLRSLLHVDARDLKFTEEAGGARKAELDIVAVAFGAGGQVVEQGSYPQTVNASAEEYERILRSGLTFIVNFPIKKAGAYQMRVAVREPASERVGTARQLVEVPDLGRGQLALSGVVVSGNNQLAASNTQPASAGGVQSSAAEPNSQLGPAVRRLPKGVILEYRYNIYNARLDTSGRPQLQTQMRLLRDGKEVFTGKVQTLDGSRQPDLKRLNAAGGIRIGPELTPGEYVLQVIVTDLLAPEKSRTAIQWADLEIVE
jgi:VWFA-related protein